MPRTAVLNVVGLTRSLLGPHTPNLNALLAGSVDVPAITPALTCSTQATYLTGVLPSEHGIVGNGWYVREHNEVMFWRQSNRLIESEKLWHKAKRHNAAITTANLFWWYNMATDVDWSVTPRPLYLADGRKLPDCYADPPELRDELTARLGTFPLFQFWGPGASLTSTQWIRDAAQHVESSHRPGLTLIYLPHLDYVLQRVGPAGPITTELQALDRICGELLDFYRERGCRVVVLSEYGIAQVHGVVHPNRLLREAGFLAVRNELGREYLDPWRSRAFAVADHQIAHVYVRHAADCEAVRALFTGIPGVEQVLDREGKRAVGLDHSRAGELVLLAKPDQWFSYYYWLHDERAPDYARLVEIHRKPGYDPAELFVDDQICFPKARIAAFLLKRRLGLRALLELTPLQASCVKGSHGRPNDLPAEGPLFMTSEPKLLNAASLASTDVCATLLNHLVVD